MITLDHVAKRYVLKPPGASAFYRRVRGRLLGRGGLPVHWALRDVSLRIPEGQAVAVLGINGSGKSTLLRLINGITQPTRGELRVNGRVGGLLDLTAGCHLDLTGIENIKLQGALLGISGREMARRMDSIIDFAELGRFIHTPVRHYSWGMLLRLAFAVTIRCDPDVLLIDEVLAVGDGYFQWKCMREIERMKAAGKTILFVTHVPGLAEALCTHAIWIHDGVIRASGSVAEVLGRYQPFVYHAIVEAGPIEWVPELSALLTAFRAGNGRVLIRRLRLLDAHGHETTVFRSGEDMEIELTVETEQPCDGVGIATVIHTINQPVSEVYSAEHGGVFDLPAGKSVLRQRFKALPLHGETYYVSVGLVDAAKPAIIYDGYIRMHSFTVAEDSPFGFSNRVLRLPVEMRVGPAAE